MMLAGKACRGVISPRNMMRTRGSSYSGQMESRKRAMARSTPGVLAFAGVSLEVCVGVLGPAVKVRT